MSSNFSSPGSDQALSIGNVVTTAIRLYRSHFKQYLILAFQAILWALIPIYGWAKCYTIYAMISRLAFSELINQPEGTTTVRSQLNPKIWTFLGSYLLVFMILFAASITRNILVFISAGVASIFLGKDSVLPVFISQVVNLICFVIYMWIYSHLLLTELPIAIEENVDASKAVSRSWELTQGHAWRLLSILLLASVITLPLMIMAGTPFVFAFISLFSALSTRNYSQEVFNSFFIFLFLGIILFLLATVLVSPFWQTIKAVIYYDLRVRREGLGLKLRDYDV